MDLTWLWIPATLFAAAAQAGRNAVQRGLTQTLGTLGATQVRFIYGFPFALLFLAVTATLTDAPLPDVNPRFVLFVLAGASVQIAATALMLAAMRERAFVVVTAWTKTEPVQVAIFGLLILNDPFTLPGAVAVLIASAGVALMSVRRSSTHNAPQAGARPVVSGLLAGACFALSAVSFRGAILALAGDQPFFLLASWTLVWSLGIQVLMLATWMLLFHPDLLRRCLAAWRVSIAGGCLGACASQGWFLGFALTSAANVRTLGLVEVLFAQLLSWRVFSQTASRREWFGIFLRVLGSKHAFLAC